MSSDTDHPRQRTVAELLAAHGGEAPASGRRRRRREADDDGDAAPVERSASTPAVERSRESSHRAAPPSQQAPAPQTAATQALQPPASPAAPRWAPQPASAPRSDGAPPVRRDAPPTAPAPSSGSSAQPAGYRSRPAGPPRDRPTDVLPRIRGAERSPVAPVLGGGPLGGSPDGPDDDGGPATMVGAAPVGAEAWHRARTGERGGTAIDGGPAPSPIQPGEGPAGLGGGRGTGLDERPDPYRTGYGFDHGAPDRAPGRPSDRAPERAAPGRDRFAGGFDRADERDGRAGPDDHDGYDEHDEVHGPDRYGSDDRYGPDDHDEHDDDGFDAPPPRERRLGRSAAAAPVGASAWGAVIVQWIAGALGGAVLWVAFRYLWRNLPVVAVAASAIVTIGLVLIVRALLHNDDRRTTVFAVLVGLLLTVSPVILVLMGR